MAHGHLATRARGNSSSHAGSRCSKQSSNGGHDYRKGSGDSARAGEGEGASGLGGGEPDRKAHGSPGAVAMVDGRGKRGRAEARL